MPRCLPACPSPVSACLPAPPRCLPACLPMPQCLPACPFPSVCLPACLPLPGVCLPACPCPDVYLPMPRCLSACLPAHAPVSACLPMPQCLPACLPAPPWCLPACLPMPRCLPAHAPVSACLPMPRCLPACLPLPGVCLPIPQCLPACPCPGVCLPACPCPNVCLPACPCPSVCLPACPSPVSACLPACPCPGVCLPMPGVCLPACLPMPQRLPRWAKALERFQTHEKSNLHIAAFSTVAATNRNYTDNSIFRLWTQHQNPWSTDLVHLHSKTCKMLKILSPVKATARTLYSSTGMIWMKPNSHCTDMCMDIAKQRGVSLATFQDVVNFLKGDQGDYLRTLLPEVTKLVKLAPTVPATSCTSERSFSGLQRLKTYLRSTTGQARLNHVAILNYHKTLSRNRNLDKIADQFIKRTATRGSTFLIKN
nr:PREDICTED: SH3 domain-containing protein C23A1.17-like [Austrofundulus limnaeus]